MNILTEKSIIEGTATNFVFNGTRIRDYCFYRRDIPSNASFSFPNLVEVGLGSFAYSKFYNRDTFLAAFSTVVDVEDDAFHNCVLGWTAISDAIYLPFSSAEGFAVMFLTHAIASVKHCHFTNLTSIGNHDMSTDLNQAYLHLYPVLVSCGTLRNNTYFEFDDGDTVLFDASSVVKKGTSKSTRTFTFYTDNTSLKNTLLSQADSYTTINVKHLDGSDWT